MIYSELVVITRPKLTKEEAKRERRSDRKFFITQLLLGSLAFLLQIASAVLYAISLACLLKLII